MLNHSKKVSVSQIINSSLTRYNELHAIVNEAFVGSSATHLDIYVDINSLTKSLYNRENEVFIEDYAVVASCLINLCAHYRDFFNRAPYHVDTTFYLVYCNNYSDMYTRTIKTYNKTMVDYMKNKTIIRDLIMKNVLLLDTLCPYLPDIHFIYDDEYETATIMNHLMEINQNASMVITKDMYTYQLINNPETIILRPKKSNGLDKSYYVNSLNVYQILAAERNNKIFDTGLSSELLSAVYTLSSCVTRNIYSVYSLRQAVSLLEQSIKGGFMLNQYNADPHTLFYRGLFDMRRDLKISDHDFIKRFEVIDVPYQTNIYNNYTHNEINITNLTDPEAVQAINNKYFKKVPLDLNRL